MTIQLNDPPISRSPALPTSLHLSPPLPHPPFLTPIFIQTKLTPVERHAILNSSTFYQQHYHHMDDPSNSLDHSDWLVTSNENINYDSCHPSNDHTTPRLPSPNYSNFDLVPPLLPDSHIPHVHVADDDTPHNILRNDIPSLEQSFVPPFDDVKRFPDMFSSDPMLGLNDFDGPQLPSHHVEQQEQHEALQQTQKQTQQLEHQQQHQQQQKLLHFEPNPLNTIAQITLQSAPLQPQLPLQLQPELPPQTQTTLQPPLQSHLQLQSQIPLQSQLQIQPQVQPQTLPQPQIQPQIQLQMQPQSQPQTYLQAQLQPGPELQQQIPLQQVMQKPEVHPQVPLIDGYTYNGKGNSKNDASLNVYKENNFNSSTGAISDASVVPLDTYKLPLSAHDTNRTQGPPSASSPSSKKPQSANLPTCQPNKSSTGAGNSCKTGRKRTRTRTEDMDPSLVHTCPTCGKKFAKKYNQKIHQRRHQGDLPFICEYEDCGKGFMWRSSFMRHLKVHEANAERPRKSPRRTTDGSDHPHPPSVDVMQVSENTSIVLLNGMKLDVDHRKLESINTAVALCRLDGTACPELLDINVDVIRQADEHRMARRCKQVSEAKKALLDMRNPQVALIDHLLSHSSNAEPPPT